MNAICKIGPGFDGDAPITESVRDIEGQGKRTITRQRKQSTIDRLLKYRLISDCQAHAAAKLAFAAERASLAVYACQGASGGLSGGLVSDAKLTAMTEHADAVSAIRWALGSLSGEAEGIIRFVVLENWTLAKTAHRMQIPPRRILHRTRAALDALAHHYGLA